MPTNKKTASKSSAKKSTSAKTATKPTVKPTPKPAEKKTPVKTVAKKPAAKKPAGPNWKIIAAIIGVAVVIAAAICIIAVVCSSNKTDESSFVLKDGNDNEVETEYVNVDDKKFYIKVPTSFKKLTTEQIAKKYTNDVTGAVYSNNTEKVDVDLAINATTNEIKNSEIKDYLDAMAGIMKEVSEVLGTDYYTVNGHNIASIRLVTDGTDGKIYNHMIFFSYEGKLVLISFNCIEDQRATWESVGDALIKSLKFEE